jgi:hypothetical protein
VNYLAHAFRFLRHSAHDESFIAGTAVPDWLNVVARRVRCRSRHAEPFVASDQPALASLARGIVRHHADDAWFHSTRAFTELSLDFSNRIRTRLNDSSDLRSGFLGHILVELLMDRVLAEQHDWLLDHYYHTLARVDASFVGQQVSHMCGGDASGLTLLIPRFCEVQFLRDYVDDPLLAMRVNQVLARVRLEPLAGELLDLLPAMHASVAGRIGELLPE